MPWKKTPPMTERLSLIELYQTRLWSMTELCTRFDISRKTAYKWLRRYSQDGLSGLQEKRRAPLCMKTCDRHGKWPSLQWELASPISGGHVVREHLTGMGYWHTTKKIPWWIHTMPEDDHIIGSRPAHPAGTATVRVQERDSMILAVAAAWIIRAGMPAAAGDVFDLGSWAQSLLVARLIQIGCREEHEKTIQGIALGEMLAGVDEFQIGDGPADQGIQLVADKTPGGWVAQEFANGSLMSFV
jgi:hypothetical protein